MDLYKFKYTISNVFNEEKDYLDLERESIRLCKLFLLEKGYRISDPLVIDYNIKTPKGLVDLFYNLHDQLCTDELLCSRNEAKDISIAKSFIKSRLINGSVDKKRALAECVSIIKTVILHKESFNFDGPISFGVFGSANCKWIADKAVDILNKEVRAQYLKKLEDKSSRFEESYKEKGYKDLDVLLMEE